MDASLAKPTHNRCAYNTLVVYALILSFILSCDSGSGSSAAVANYQGSWESATPVETTVNVPADTINGQPDTVNIDGEMTVNLEFSDDGSLDILFHFTSSSPPLCDTNNPCHLQSTPGDVYTHLYLGNGVTPEGLEASRMKIVNEDNSQYAVGYAYVSDGRLCISNELWKFILPSHENSASDPLAIDFIECFIRKQSA